MVFVAAVFVADVVLGNALGLLLLTP